MLMSILKILVGIGLISGAVQLFKDWKIWECEIRNGLKDSPIKTLLIIAVVVIVLVLILKWIF